MTGSWRRRMVWLVLVLLVIESAMVITDTGPRLVLVTSLGVLIAGWAWLAVDLDIAAVRTERSRPRGAPTDGGTHNLRLTALRHDLALSRRDHRLPERLHASLVELVDDELLASHGVDRIADRAAAAVVMGDELARFVDRSDATPVRSPDDLARIVALIERI